MIFMKKNKRGFILIETLLVTMFVAGALIFVYIQFSKLNNYYDDSYKYNTVEGLYALEDIKNYILNDTMATEYIGSNIETQKFIDITDCSIFTDVDNCLNLINIENIKSIFVTTNNVPKDNILKYDEDFNSFINKISPVGSESYRIVAKFDNLTYATLRLY